jgi:dipeptidyl aminopeptidase/acylaminoacyl peptidase
VPYEEGYFPAWFVPPVETTRTQAPVALYLPGWDSTKEQGYVLADHLADRGIATLLCDGPGIGEALRELGLVNRYDYEVPGSAAVDYLMARTDVDPQRIFVVGSSLGGYRAARVCAFEQRVAALVVWGAVWDFHEVWLEGRKKDGVLPTRDAHAVEALGLDSIDEAPSALSSWKLVDVAGGIEMPTLILHGEADHQVPIWHARQLFCTISARDKSLIIFPRGELGSAHCQNDHRHLAHVRISDWLLDQARRSGSARGRHQPAAIG